MTNLHGSAFAPVTDPEMRRTERRRLAQFLAAGTALFLIAVVGAAFVPLRWPDLVRRAGHSIIFVPAIYWLTMRMLRRDSRDRPFSPTFDSRPVSRDTIPWLTTGGALAGTITAIFMWLFGLHWTIDPAVGPGALALMLFNIAIIAAAEEIAFRGYALWRLVRLIGIWPAQVIIAIAFAVSHLTLGGYALLPALAGTIVGSILYGIVFVRTGGLAAPIALHVGWNIVQHVLLSPLEPSAAVLRPAFLHPVTTSEYASMLLIVGTSMAIAAAILWRRGQSPPVTAT